MSHIVSYTGKIHFDVEGKTKKHQAQAEWKRVAMVVFNCDMAKYYRWFLEKRFNLRLNEIHREPHVTFINDRFDELNGGIGTAEAKEIVWQNLKNKWDGKEINITLNLRPFSNSYHWWLIVDHKYRQELHDIRAEAGLGRPYFGLHMTFGILTDFLDGEGNILFNHQLEHSKYINQLNDSGLIEMNKDYLPDGGLEIKRLPYERVDLYNSKDEIFGTLYNDRELNHVRIQIARNKLEGYYIKWKDKKIDISTEGELSEWPNGLYDMERKQVLELIKIKRENEKTTN